MIESSTKNKNEIKNNNTSNNINSSLVIKEALQDSNSISRSY